MPRASLVALLALAAACQADAVTIPQLPEAPAPDGAIRMSARIDGRTYVASNPGGFSIQHIQVNKGGIRLGATFQGAAGGGAVNAASHQLTVAGTPDGGPLPERVVFNRYDAFSGSLYWIAPGQAVELWVGLYEPRTGRYLLGPWPITVERRSHDAGGDRPAGAT